MADWVALEEMEVTLRSSERTLQQLCGEAQFLDLLHTETIDRNAKLGSELRAFFKRIPNRDQVRTMRFRLENVLEEKSSPKFVGECMIRELFPRCVYNFALSKRAYLEDVYDLLDEGEATSCLAVFRAMRKIGRHESFVPPSGRVSEAVFAEDTYLQSQVRLIAQVEQLQKLKT